VSIAFFSSLSFFLFPYNLVLIAVCFVFMFAMFLSFSLSVLRYPMASLADSLALFLKQDVLKRSRKMVREHKHDTRRAVQAQTVECAVLPCSLCACCLCSWGFCRFFVFLVCLFPC
jgi:hypothetical protein